MPNDSEWFNSILDTYTQYLRFTSDGRVTYNTPSDSIPQPEIQYVKKYNKELSKSINKMIHDEIDKAFEFKNKIIDSKDLAYTVRHGKLIIYRLNRKTNKSIGLFKTDNSYKLEKIPDVSTYRAYNIGIPERNILRTFCDVKIKSFQESADLFGYKPTKEFMMKSGQQFEISNMILDYTCKKDGIIRNVVEVIFKDKALKFLPEDLEFIYPDLELLRKGYTEPLDRKIKKGSNVKVVDDRGIPFKKNTRLKVNTVITVGHSSFGRKYCSILNDYKEYLIPTKKLKVVA
jgi:hypothetical protein